MITIKIWHSLSFGEGGWTFFFGQVAKVIRQHNNTIVLSIKLYFLVTSTYMFFLTLSYFLNNNIWKKNKRPMGHIAHLRKQFKSIKTYGYIITLIKRRMNNIIYGTLWEFFVFSFEESWIPLTKGCFVLRLVEIGSVVLEKKIFNFNMFFYYFVIISPWKRGGALHLNKLESPSPKDALCQVWLKLAQWFWRRRWKCEKFTTTTTTTTTTDNGQILIRKAHLSFRLRWAKKIGFKCTNLCELSTKPQNKVSFWNKNMDA